MLDIKGWGVLQTGALLQWGGVFLTKVVFRGKKSSTKMMLELVWNSAGTGAMILWIKQHNET